MDLGPTLTRFLIPITTIGLPISIILLIIGVILDIVKKRFYWSKFALILFVIILVLEIIQIKFIYQTTSQILQQSPRASTSVTDETANWKTYTNTSHGYSIKYPTTWIAYENNTPNSVTLMSAPDYPSDGEIGIEVEANQERLDGKQWAQKDAQTTCIVQPCTPSLTFGEEITVGGIKTFVVSGQLPKWTQEAVYIPYNEKMYIIRASSNVSGSTITQTFRKILSTFQFSN